MLPQSLQLNSVAWNGPVMAMQGCLLFACALFGTYEAAYVDTLHACPVKDEGCFKNSMQNVLKDLSSKGIPEYDIPPIDPLEVKNIDVPVLNLLNITIIEGVVKGVKDCIVKKFDVQPDKGNATIELLCDIEIKGKSKIIGSNPDLHNMFGSESVQGDGNFEIKFTKLQSISHLRYRLIKKDGEVYVKPHQDEFTYEYDLGDAKISADKIYIGDKDESKLVVDYLNQNWRLISNTFGKKFMDVIINILHEKVVLFTDSIAVKYFISDDLTSFAKND